MSYSSSAQGFGLCPGVRCSLEVFSANCSLPIFGMDAQWWEWVWHVKGMGLRGQGMIKKLMPGLQALHDAGVPSSRVSLPSSLRPGSPCLLFPLPKQRGANSGPYDSGAGGGDVLDAALLTLVPSVLTSSLIYCLRRGPGLWRED